MSDENKKDCDTPGEVLTPEVVDSPNKKPRYAPGSRKGKGGRPSHDHIFERPVVQNFITYLIKRDASDREIARQINVPLTSFIRWKKRNPEFWHTEEENSIKQVERALLDRAKGFWIERPIYDKMGNLKGTKYHYYPPSESAAQYYLNNRDPANWKSKVEHNHAIEELPLAVNFVRASDKKLPAPGRAITDDFGNVVYPAKDDNQGNS